MAKAVTRKRPPQSGHPFKKDQEWTHHLNSTFFWTRIFVDTYRRGKGQICMRQAFDRTIRMYNITAQRHGFSPRTNVICFSTVKEKYIIINQSKSYCLYVQTLRSGVAQRGRKDNLRVNTPKSTKSNARTMTSDMKYIESMVILSGFDLFFYAYWVKNLHARPHGTVKKRLVSAGLKQMLHNNVEVRVVTQKELDCGVLCIPNHDMTIFLTDIPLWPALVTFSLGQL